MECITISSDEEDVQVLTVKLAPTIKNVSSVENNQQTSVIKIGEKEQSKKHLDLLPQTDSNSINGVIPTIQGVPVISLIDDGEDNELSESTSEQRGVVLRSKNNLPFRRTERVQSANIGDTLKNGHVQKDSSGIKIKNSDNLPTKKKKSSVKDTDAKGGKHLMRVESDKNKDQIMTVSNEPLITKLLETCRKVEYGEEMVLVERKIWNYFNAASPSKTHSLEFKSYLENTISRIENILSSTKDKFLISRIIKDCINEMKSDPSVVTGKLRQLYCVYEKLVKKITKLEETEVDSDDDNGNPYMYLDRYRRKAVDVYNKICELEGRATDADRPTLQRFFFTGSSAPVPIQRALERYYNKTHIFPDFYDVKKLVKKVNKEEKLNLSENEIYKTAQNVFIEFGERLVCRRKYDDYNILVDYLKEGQCEDPADRDTELQMKLEKNKRTRKKEQEVLDKYAMQDASNTKKDEVSSGDKAKDKKMVQESEEISTINVSSSSSSASSLSSSPASSDVEESARGFEQSDDEKSEEPVKQDNALFSDSEEEFTLIEITEKRRKCEINELSSKRIKTDKDISSESNPFKPLEIREIETNKPV